MDTHRTLREPATRADSGELHALLSEHGAAMYRVAVSIVQDGAMAEDVVQDSIIKVWDGLDGYRGDAPVRAWILRITHNTAVSTLRKVRDEAWDPSTLPEVEAPGSVERVAAAHDQIDTLRDALADLDPLSRSILALRNMEAMSYDEIADTLGITVGQVKIRLFRTRKRLAEQVKGVDHG
ncbi:MAG: RNA polymerase sigma factor [Acidimicrobiales bacterium]